MMVNSRPTLSPQVVEQASHYAAIYHATVIANPWVAEGFLRLPRVEGAPPGPNIKQAQFLVLGELEALYGGAARGGKSVALLMAALQYVDVPGYSALLLRRQFTDLTLAGALLDLSHTVLQGTDAKWRGQDRMWVFPSSAKLQFGYLDNLGHMYRYQSAAFQFIGFDELTQFPEVHYRYLFSRLTRTQGVNVPLRMRAATNPGGVGADWVRQRFIVEGDSSRRRFIPARLTDNPHTDQVAYRASLAQLDPVTRQQLLNGDWDIRVPGNLFKRQWFKVVPVGVAGRSCRWWDLAATAGGGDYTVGLRLTLGVDNNWYIEDVRRGQWGPGPARLAIREAAEIDGTSVMVRMGQEPGAAGKILADDLARNALMGWDFRAVPETGPKVVRAGPAAAAAEGGRIFLVEGPWITHFLDEVETFPAGAHDDQVDALSGAMACLAGQQRWRAL
jgi:predicted phage terminase large subunit-like protein